MNLWQIRNLRKMLIKRHYARKISYMFYQHPILISDRNWYPPADRKTLANNIDRNLIINFVRSYFKKRIKQRKSSNKGVLDPIDRIFSFSNIQPSYGNYAWVFGVVTNYRVNSNYQTSGDIFRVMLKNVYTFFIGMQPHLIEQHVWIDVGLCKSLNPSITVGLGDIVVMLAKPNHYQYMNKFHSHGNPFQRYGVIKRNLDSAILVGSYYPIIRNQRVELIERYPHGSHFLFKILNHDHGRKHYIIGNDIDANDRQKFLDDRVRLFELPIHRQQYFTHKIKWYVNNRMRGHFKLRSLVAVCYRSTHIVVRISLLRKYLTMRLKILSSHKSNRKAYYTLNHHLIIPLIKFNQSLRIIDHNQNLSKRQMATTIRNELNLTEKPPLVSFTFN